MGKRPGSLAAYTKIWKCRLCPCCPTGDKVLQGDHPNVPRERLHQPTGLQVSKMDTPCLAICVQLLICLMVSRCREEKNRRCSMHDTEELDSIADCSIHEPL